MIVEVERAGMLTLLERETLAARLHLCMVKRGMTVNQYAKASRVGASTLRRYMKAECQPQPDIVAKLADGAGCDREWLYFGRGDAGWVCPWPAKSSRNGSGL